MLSDTDDRQPKDFATMSILPQPFLFSWREVDATSEIFRLTRLLDVLPDQPLLDALERQRAGRRNDYPLRALWRALLAAIVFGHPSLASLGRELARNGQLRDLCGFDPLRADPAGPPPWVWTRFIARLRRHQALIDAMFEQLVELLAARLPGLGRDLAIDGKAIGAWSRRDPQASDGFKNYEGQNEAGEPLLYAALVSTRFRFLGNNPAIYPWVNSYCGIFSNSPSLRAD
jgi:hypothetical protein